MYYKQSKSVGFICNDFLRKPNAQRSLNCLWTLKHDRQSGLYLINIWLEKQNHQRPHDLKTLCNGKTGGYNFVKLEFVLYGHLTKFRIIQL